MGIINKFETKGKVTKYIAVRLVIRMEAITNFVEWGAVSKALKSVFSVHILNFPYEVPQIKIGED